MAQINIPKPFLIIVDDLGWWDGRDGSKANQPFRTGMQRNHVPEDYSALAALGKAFDMRIPAGFVLCEWDRDNILRQLPSATWMGDQWACPFTDSVCQEEAAAILKNACAYIEPAIHGIGHEFWKNGKMERTEFHTPSGRMRRGDEVKQHLDYFFRLMAHSNIDPDLRIFIPPALNHSFGFGDQGFQKIAASFGIRFIPLLFQRTRCKHPPQLGNLGWECGVAAVDRGKAPIAWNTIGPAPRLNPGQAILPLHWSNILHEDPAKNMDVVRAWIRAITSRITAEDLLPARDIAQFLTQFVNHTHSRIKYRGNTVVIEMDWVKKLPGPVLSDAIFFSANLPPGTKLKIIGAQTLAPATPWEEKAIKVRRPESGKIVFQFSPNH